PGEQPAQGARGPAGGLNVCLERASCPATGPPAVRPRMRRPAEGAAAARVATGRPGGVIRQKLATLAILIRSERDTRRFQTHSEGGRRTRSRPERIRGEPEPTRIAAGEPA